MFQKRYKQFSQGTAQDNLRQEELLSLKCPVPPVSEKQRISSILSAYDDLIENNRRRIQSLQTVHSIYLLHYQAQERDTPMSLIASTSATDPDGNQVNFLDWGDGTTSMTSLVNSGTKSSASHSWSSAGTSLIKARATDSRGAISGWSSALSVKMT
jgi:hypothetical protein